MTDITRPFLALYIVWHPDFTDGAVIAEKLREHYRRNLYENISGGTGLSVLFRSQPTPEKTTPIPISLDEAQTTAIIVLADEHLVSNADWLQYVNELANQTEAAGLASRLFPVSITATVLAPLGVSEQALRWDSWSGTSSALQQRLTTELTYEFCRMLRHYLEHLKRPTEEEEALQAYLKKVQIFLSHSKHDDHGVAIAYNIRNQLYAGHGLAGFFDVHDIPAGLRFNKVLLQQVRVSAMVAIHTDSYSSREWCRREIIEAKRWNVPLVIANSISDIDERGFPYMGNVPVVRLDPQGEDRINFVISRLLDEVLKDFLWRCQIEVVKASAGRNVVFTPRPPELISLANLPPTEELPAPVIVYPDPPLGAEEERLFADVAPHVQLRSLTEWLAGAER